MNTVKPNNKVDKSKIEQLLNYVIKSRDYNIIKNILSSSKNPDYEVHINITRHDIINGIQDKFTWDGMVTPRQIRAVITQNNYKHLFEDVKPLMKNIPQKIKLQRNQIIYKNGSPYMAQADQNIEDPGTGVHVKLLNIDKDHQNFGKVEDVLIYAGVGGVEANNIDCCNPEKGCCDPEKGCCKDGGFKIPKLYEEYTELTDLAEKLFGDISSSWYYFNQK